MTKSRFAVRAKRLFSHKMIAGRSRVVYDRDESSQAEEGSYDRQTDRLKGVV